MSRERGKTQHLILGGLDFQDNDFDDLSNAH